MYMLGVLSIQELWNFKMCFLYIPVGICIYRKTQVKYKLYYYIHTPLYNM